MLRGGDKLGYTLLYIKLIISRTYYIAQGPVFNIL